VRKHRPGKAVTEYDDHLFCLLAMNHRPPHLDAHDAETGTEFNRDVVVGDYIYSPLLGLSVPDASGKALADLEVESLRHFAPTFRGDTILRGAKRATRPRRVNKDGESGRPGRREHP
jgi:acyl dehydratase